MRICALDLSKRSTGWALWAPGDKQPASGVFTLGSEYTSKGRTFGKLHEMLSGLNSIGTIDALFYEEPLQLGPHSGITNADTINTLVGLAMHVESFGDAMGCRIIRAVNQSSWRSHFFGGLRRPKDAAGKPMKIDFKSLAMTRCGHFGWKPAKHDQAEALGILDFAVESVGLPAPWRMANALLPELNWRSS